NVAELGWDDPNRDIFFSSKGHDVPGLYAALHALGEIPTERLLRLRRLGGIVVVMTGDGELQEGQNWEALASAAHQRVGNLWAIVDRNELQSDRPTEEILALGDLEAKLGAFGSHVEVCDGHDHDALASAFASMRAAPGDVPKVLVANTIKGRGVSFMEHPAALREGGGTYRWHAGAPDDGAFARAH